MDHANVTAEAMDVLRFLVEHIVGNGNCFHITPSEDEKGTLLLLQISRAEAGRVIGKSGKTSNAIRQVLRALATKNNVSYFLKIEVWDGKETQ